MTGRPTPVEAGRVGVHPRRNRRWNVNGSRIQRVMQSGELRRVGLLCFTEAWPPKEKDFSMVRRLHLHARAHAGEGLGVRPGDPRRLGEGMAHQGHRVFKELRRGVDDEEQRQLQDPRRGRLQTTPRQRQLQRVGDVGDPRAHATYSRATSPSGPRSRRPSTSGPDGKPWRTAGTWTSRAGGRAV